MHYLSIRQMHRPFSNVLETQYCKVLDKSSGWFDFTEPHLNTSLKDLAHQSSGALILSKPLEPHDYRDSKVCRVLKHQFGVVQHYRTFTRHTIKGEARCAA